MSEEPNASKRVKYWGNYSIRIAFFTCAVLYLLFSAEFTAIQAVYEAY